MDLKRHVRDIPDFPKKGILFRDISPLLADPEALHEAAKALVARTNLDEIDAFVGIESRGFILAALCAGLYKKGFVPLRKAGKLPPPVHQESYKLEYGEATLEIAPGQGRVLIVDDVLATGGTLRAAQNLTTKAGYDVNGCAVLINLTALNQMRSVHSAINY